MSDNDSVQFFASIARAGKLNVKKAVVARSTTRLHRLKNRAIINSKVDEVFIAKLRAENIKLTVHWDGKLMRNTTSNGKESILVDRLPVVVTGKGIEKTLGVPKLTSGMCKLNFLLIFFIFF